MLSSNSCEQYCSGVRYLSDWQYSHIANEFTRRRITHLHYAFCAISATNACPLQPWHTFSSEETAPEAQRHRQRQGRRASQLGLLGQNQSSS